MGTALLIPYSVTIAKDWLRQARTYCLGKTSQNLLSRKDKTELNVWKDKPELTV